MGTVTVRPVCAHCSGTRVLLRRRINADGSAHIAWRCLDCNRWAENPPKWMGHKEIVAKLARWKATLEDVPIIEDYRDRQPCCICGEPGQYHHWSPQALHGQFGDDWYKWPGAYLCPFHHRLWHRVVTPTLVGGGVF